MAGASLCKGCRNNYFVISCFGYVIFVILPFFYKLHLTLGYKYDIIPITITSYKEVLALNGCVIEGNGYRLYNQSCLTMPQIDNNEISLTITSPPYWNAIDYDIHVKDNNAWHRDREYSAFGGTYNEYLENIEKVFTEVLRVTIDGGFCAIVIGTILYKGKHYPAPMSITERMQRIGWNFHQDIIWNKVTGGIRRAGSYIQHPKSGYYYPNIMTEYILIFRKNGDVRRGKNPSIAVDELFTRDIANNIWHIAPVPPRTIKHPCPFPEELARRVLLLYSDDNEVILDPFIGSGQTAIAALRYNRQCIGYDVEMNYLKLAEERIMSPPPIRKHNLITKYEHK